MVLMDINNKVFQGVSGKAKLFTRLLHKFRLMYIGNTQGQKCGKLSFHT